jgi:hypothetical protein
MNDTMRKRLAALILAVSFAGGTALAATSAPFESAWTEGNNQPQSGLFVQDKERFTGGFLTGANETHTGSLTALP